LGMTIQVSRCDIAQGYRPSKGSVFVIIQSDAARRMRSSIESASPPARMP